jgi:hypothetical protein
MTFISLCLKFPSSGFEWYCIDQEEGAQFLDAQAKNLNLTQIKYFGFLLAEIGMKLG